MYLKHIFGVDLISFNADKVLYHVCMSSSSCHKQRSPLMVGENNNTYLLQKQSKKLAHKIQVTSVQTDCMQILKILMHA